MAAEPVGGTNPKVCFYADDFTGATDALAWFTAGGLTARLFVEPEALEEHLTERRSDVEVLGLAGLARNLGGPELDRELAKAFELLSSCEPALMQYKVCSTFDSSADRGSIGRAIEMGALVLGENQTVVAPAQPDYGRYTFGGNHFALHPESHEIHRLDRHPIMSVHPSTPMGEADLRRVLEAQTTLRSSLVHLFDVRTPEVLARSVNEVGEGDPSIVVCDAIDNEDLTRIVSAIDLETPRLLVGSGGLSRAIGTSLGTHGAVQPSSAAPAGPVLAVCGSLSSQTSRQIASAEASGWRRFTISSPTGKEGGSRSPIESVMRQVCDGLRNGENVIVDTASPQDRPDRSRARRSLVPPEVIGAQLADVVRHALLNTDVRRVLIAGGDTSGYVLRSLGVESVSLVSVVQPGVSLCRVTSADPDVAGIEVALKGGQMGDQGLFEAVRLGVVDPD